MLRRIDIGADLLRPVHRELRHARDRGHRSRHDVSVERLWTKPLRGGREMYVLRWLGVGGREHARADGRHESYDRHQRNAADKSS